MEADYHSPEDCQQDIDPEINATAGDEENTQRRN